MVREIPDKPPPPYIPPADNRNFSMRRFTPDDCLETKIQQHLQENNYDLHIDSDDSYEEFIKDFCLEKSERQQCEVSDKPWDACNLLPKLSDKCRGDMQKQTSVELREVLTGPKAGSTTALANRRSDHIDDILFSEWRRCESEWTSLHIDEANVKNQLFESIFQKMISETIDEYKRTVINRIPDSE